MSSSDLKRINEQGWRVGFANLLRKELWEWWGTRTWLVQIIIWGLILNGLLGAFLWMPASASSDTDTEESAAASEASDPIVEALEVFFIIAGMAIPVGVTIISQGLFMDEKRSGTLEWVLSKPVSRTAVILSKLIATAIGVIVIMVAFQGAIAYLQLSAKGASLSLPHFIAALALLALSTLFYLTLVLLLGVVSKGRGWVIGLPMLLIFGYQFILGLAPWLAEITPWGLVMPGLAAQPLTVQLATQQPLTSGLPILMTIGWCVLFTVLAVWRFNKLEF